MRCFVDESQWDLPEIALAPEESHHLLKVLRARLGCRLGLFSGCGHSAEAELIAVQHGRALVRVFPQTRRVLPAPAISYTLVQALPKHTLMDWIVQKSVELGVAALVPLLTERVVARLAPAEAERRVARWRKIAREAARQCGVFWEPQIASLQTVDALPPLIRKMDVCFLGSLRADALPFRRAAGAVRAQAPRKLGFIIGPEGDLADAEYDACIAAGARAVSFGARVLRVETAALYAMSLLDYEFAQPCLAETMPESARKF